MMAHRHGRALWRAGGGLAAALLLLAGCVRYGGPAPVAFKGSTPESAHAPADPAAPPRADIPDVRPVRKPPPPARPAPAAAVAVESLPEIEPEPDPDAAAAAPAAAGTVTVEKGDTLYSLARRHRVSLRELIEINGLDPPYLLLEGQTLTLPRPREHEVAKGDTVYGISRRYGVDMAALVRANGIAPPYTITVGQTLRLPATTGTPQAAAAKPRDGAAGGEATAAAVVPDRSIPVGEPPPRAGPSFAWPVRGRIISTFGPKRDGLHNDGVNILVEKGAPVAAAENGVVAYAGNELRGFGNLILLKHADGWMTAYAHNDRLLVRRGQKVARGQVIARAGNTGNVKTPQLHFEIRRGARAVNPNQHLASAEGL